MWPPVPARFPFAVASQSPEGSSLLSSFGGIWMLRTSLFRPALAAGAALTLAACQENPSPTAVNPGPLSASVQSSQGSDLPSVDELDRQVPGFGGFFLDRNGTPTVYLSPGSSRAPAERALAGYLTARGLSASS